MFWIFFAAMVFVILGAAFSLIGGVEGDIRRIGLWNVMGAGVLALLILLFAPHRLGGAERRER